MQSCQRKKSSKIKLWGDQYSTETKAMIMALKYCGVDYEFKIVETKLGEVADEEEARETILRENDTLAAALGPAKGGKEVWIGGNGDFLSYLRDVRPELEQAAGRGMFPDGLKVRTAVTWHNQVMRPACLQYMVLKHEKKDTADVEEELIELILPELERQLTHGYTFIAGETICFADVLMYVEMNQLEAVSGTAPKSDSLDTLFSRQLPNIR